LHKILNIFKEPMFLLLFGTALLYFILGEPSDGLIMIGFVAFMAAINIFQEWRTDKTLQALKDLSAPRVKVIREDRIETIEGCQVVMDDLMILQEGEKISADAILIESYDLGVDESTLTGESEVVWKKQRITQGEESSHFKRNMCYTGTIVTQGRAIVKVTGVGALTEYGKIGVDLLTVPQEPTPLEKQTRHLIKVCALIGLFMFVTVVMVTFINTNDIVESLLSGITLAMAMIPEEFPVILTVFLAMGCWRLAKKNALIRRMPSVETLGAVSVLCTDKTGTLTKNEMNVESLYPYGKTTEVQLIKYASLASEPFPFDPMEKAILSKAESMKLDVTRLHENRLISEYPFSSETKMMGHIWEIEGMPLLAAKGSCESILPLCQLSPEEVIHVSYHQEEMAKLGYRVIAIGLSKNMDAIPEVLSQNNLELLGLIGLQDPPRAEVMDAIKICNKAGIRVVMITGDNGTTAKAIASKIGIENSENVLTGTELDTLSDEILAQRVKETNIYARVIPNHKMRIVKALKDNGEVVAMTGDGVNDAPALKYSDIGISMGKRGTEVAKEASDMILLDDNFTTIVETVHDGRRIYDNIRKAVGYVFVIHIPIALLALIAPILNLPLILLPIHVVLLELIIDPTCSIIFERQPAEANIMTRKPRHRNDSLVDRRLLGKSILQGLSIFIGVFGTYYYALQHQIGIDTARTLGLIILIVSNLFLVYVNRSESEFSLSMMFKCKDHVLIKINLLIVTMLALVIYTPLGNILVKTTPVSFRQLIISILIAFCMTHWYEVVKWINRLKLN
ncbi:MAG: cation-translocating P-type ATPase, partial [Turicibacter sp.]